MVSSSNESVVLTPEFQRTCRKLVKWHRDRGQMNGDRVIVCVPDELRSQTAYLAEQLGYEMVSAADLAKGARPEVKGTAGILLTDYSADFVTRGLDWRGDEGERWVQRSENVEEVLIQGFVRAFSSQHPQSGVMVLSRGRPHPNMFESGMFPYGNGPFDQNDGVFELREGDRLVKLKPSLGMYPEEREWIEDESEIEL